MGAKENIANAKKAIQSINEQDWNFIPKIVSLNFVRHDLSGGFDEIEGDEGLKDFSQLA